METGDAELTTPQIVPARSTQTVVKNTRAVFDIRLVGGVLETVRNFFLSRPSSSRSKTIDNVAYVR